METTEVKPKKKRTVKTAGDLEVEAFEARRQELKAKHKEVIAVIVPLDDLGTHWTACFIAKPSRPTTSLCISLMAKDQPIQASELILRDSWIEGDEKILEDDDLMFAAHMTIQGLIKFRVGILKKN